MNRNQEPLPWVDPRSDAPESLRQALGAAARGPSHQELAQLARATEAALSGGGGGTLTKGAGGGLSVPGVAALSKALALVAGVGVATAVWMGKGPVSLSTPTRAPVDLRPAAADLRPAAAGPSRGSSVPAVAPEGVVNREDRAPSADLTAVVPVTGAPAPMRSPSVRAVPAPRALVETTAEPPAPPTAAPLAGATDEVEILSQARALLAKSPDRALALARDHEARFPHGRLAQERDALVVQALRRLGLAAEARKADETFRARYPDSLYNRAVETPSAEQQ
jgi:hypothetical protein